MLTAIVLMMDKFDITPLDISVAWMDRDETVNRSSTSSLIRERARGMIEEAEGDNA